jgi:hypothetical protein
LSLMNSDAELAKFLYAVINVGLLVVAVALRRPMFAIFGSMGVAGYIGHLSYRVFKDSILFPVAITALGLCLVAVGVIYHRNRRQIEAATRSLVPEILVGLLPPRARES